MPSFRRIAVAVWVLTCSLSAELRGAEIVEHPFLGITHITRTETVPRAVRMHVVQIDLAAPGIAFQLTPPSGTLETIRQTTLGFIEETQAQVAVNGHYFLPFPSTSSDAMLVGLGAWNGDVYSAFESPTQAYAIVRDAPALNIDPGNFASIVHRHPDFADGVHVLEDVTLWNVVAGSAQIVTNGVKTIPSYADAQHPAAQLTPGGPGNYSNANSWYDQINARTAIGLTQDRGTLILLTVDGAGGSLGMSVGEVADVLVRDYGAYDALNLDGGGSTTLAMENPTSHVRSIVNVSTDNPGGRAVGSNLAVFAAPDPSGPSITTVDVRVASNADDAEEALAGGVTLTSTDLELTDDGGVQTVGMRFSGVAIPRGASILAAWVQFQVDEVSTAAATLRIEGEAANSAAVFAASARNVSTRPRTAVAVAWTPAPWPTEGAAGLAQRTPDLATVVQEIVARSGWISGNALALVVTGTGKRVAEAHDGLPGAAPLLHVEYAVGTSTTTTSVSTTSTTGPSTSSTSTSSSSSSSSTSSSTSTSTSNPSTTVTSTTTAPVARTIEMRVAANADDAEEASAGGVNLTSSDLELIDDGGAQTVGIRFAAVAIPRGARILTAWVQFQVDEVSTATATLKIDGEAAGSAAVFAVATRNISSRQRTAAAVSWVPAPWPTEGAAGSAQRTPDLSAVVQEIVVRPGWTSGNALALIVTGTGKRVAEAHDGLPSAAPLLHVEYTEGSVTTTTLATSTTTTPVSTSSTTSTTAALARTVEVRVAVNADDAEETTAGSVDLSSSDLELIDDGGVQIVGIRFAAVAIPRGAQILTAWVQFQVDEVSTAAAALKLEGEAANSAAVFTTATRNVSNRQRTAAAVAWTPAPWPTVGAAGSAQRTPDLRAVVQEIVARPGWTGGSALALIVTGSGKRVAESHDGLPGAAPLLHIEYADR